MRSVGGRGPLQLQHQGGPGVSSVSSPHTFPTPCVRCVCHHHPLPTHAASGMAPPSLTYPHATSLPADFVVDQMQAVKFAFDIARGMAFLHTLEPLIPRHHLNSRSIMVSVSVAWPSPFSCRLGQGRLPSDHPSPPRSTRT